MTHTLHLFWSCLYFRRTDLDRYIVCRPIHRCDILAQVTKLTYPLKSSRHTLPFFSFDEATNAMITDYANNEYNDEKITEVQFMEHPQSEQTNNWSFPVRKSRQCVILPFRESPALVTTSAAGIVTLDPHPHMAREQTVTTAKAS